MGPRTNAWERLYRSSDVTQLPWYTPRLDADVKTILGPRPPDVRKVLDLGTGPATQAIALAKLGYDVVATDISGSAIRRARKRAREEGVAVDFRVDDILDSRLEDGLVDAIVDRGVFHGLPPDERPHYVDEVHRILRPRGLLLLKTFSVKEPGDEGPYRFSERQLRGYFGGIFEVLSLRETTFQGRRKPDPKALFGVFRRR